ncbi:MAG: YraN family protein [Firmicutes bacterium]|nr:YraN family protein [Bacillota bacterium]
MAGSRRQTGAAGEEQARRFLLRSGYQILQMNYRCRFGEIDIIAREGPLLVFVEVRTRTGTGFGKAVESLTATKKKRLRRLVRYYLARELGREIPCRVDLVAIDMEGPGRLPRLSHIKGVDLWG